MAATTPRHAAAANGNHDGEDEPPAARAGLPCANATLSPWLKEPSKRLLGHRSTAELPGSADVVVVGSGITGAFAAHFLKAGAARGQSVVMLEAREACWGASGRTTGLIEPRLFAATMEGAAFEAESYRLVRDIVRVAGIKCDWVDSTCLYFNDEPLTTFGEAIIDEFAERFPALNKLLGAQRLRAAATAVEDDGEEDEKKHGKGEGKEGGAAAEGRLLAEAIRERLGRVGVDAADGCITMPNAATMNPYKLVTWLLEHLLDEFDADEFALHTNTPVTALATSSGGSGGGGGGGWTLTTPRGDMRAAKVLLATNGYTSALLPAFADLISPVRAQACALVPKPGGAAAAAAAGGGPRIDLARCAYNFVAADGSHDNYIIQRPRDSIGTGTGTGTGGGELISDGARHLAPGRGVGEWRDDAADADVAAHLRALLRRVVDANGGQGKAEFGDAEDEEDVTALDWTGVMGFSRDRIPWVGRVPESHGGGPGLFLCAAYTGRGLTVAPLCARWVAHDMMAAEGGGGEGGGEGGGGAAATAEDAEAMSNMPAGFRIDLPGRLETVEDEWPDVATIEEGGSTLVLKTVIHKLMTKWCGYGDCYDGAPPELTVHGTLRTIQQAYDELVGGGGRGHGHRHVGK
ncbi:hypothetical protein RB600_008348 [Gaeumannomyces tritici]